MVIQAPTPPQRATVALLRLDASAFDVLRATYASKRDTLVAGLRQAGFGIWAPEGAYYLLTLNWEMRWYMVSDESLRIREGLVRVREQTMTVANIQTMRVRQGPLQRLFGLSELEVHTAGGGGRAPDEGKRGDRDLHVGHFRGLEDAWALRDRLREALARHRASGLGDQDEDPAALPRDRNAAPDRNLQGAADALLAEARRLRASLGG